jgi:hypothetical protein
LFTDMTARTRTFTTAWLGLVAMCLIVLAPLVSQLIDAYRAQQPDAALCSAVLAAPASHHGAQDDSLAACGYCDLLATHATMPAMPGVSLPLLTLVVITTISARAIHYAPPGAFPSGQPRAPPAFR